MRSEGFGNQMASKTLRLLAHNDKIICNASETAASQYSLPYALLAILKIYFVFFELADGLLSRRQTE
jgi:hypothetical protein